MKNKLYLFLDVDGTLNNEKFYERDYQSNGEYDLSTEIDYNNLKYINSLCSYMVESGFEVNVIICAGCRKTHDVEKLNIVFKKCLAEFDICGITPIMRKRDDEIIKYFKKNGMDYKNEKFIIIDDDRKDLTKLHRNLIYVDNYYGFVEKDLEKAILLFNKKYKI